MLAENRDFAPECGFALPLKIAGFCHDLRCCPALYRNSSTDGNPCGKIPCHMVVIRSHTLPESLNKSRILPGAESTRSRSGCGATGSRGFRCVGSDEGDRSIVVLEVKHERSG